MKTLFFILFLSCTITTASNDIYQNISDTGVVEYSDVKSLKNKHIILNEPNLFPALEYKSVTNKPVLINYSDIIITKPHNTKTIRNNGGLIYIETNTILLHSEHEFVLFLNNEIVSRSKIGNFTLHNVYRGAHILSIAIIDNSGRIVIQSKNIAVFVFRATIHSIH